jgi:hypothetical protein
MFDASRDAYNCPCGIAAVMSPLLRARLAGFAGCYRAQRPALMVNTRLPPRPALLHYGPAEDFNRSGRPVVFSGPRVHAGSPAHTELLGQAVAWDGAALERW